MMEKQFKQKHINEKNIISINAEEFHSDMMNTLDTTIAEAIKCEMNDNSSDAERYRSVMWGTIANTQVKKVPIKRVNFRVITVAIIIVLLSINIFLLIGQNTAGANVSILKQFQWMVNDILKVRIYPESPQELLMSQHTDKKMTDAIELARPQLPFSISIPRYIPSGYTFHRIDIPLTMDEQKMFIIEYRGTKNTSIDKPLSILIQETEVTQDAPFTPDMIIGKDTSYTQFNEAGIVYTVIKYDEEYTVVFWNDGYIYCQINATVSEEDAKKIALNMTQYD